MPLLRSISEKDVLKIDIKYLRHEDLLHIKNELIKMNFFTAIFQK